MPRPKFNKSQQFELDIPEIWLHIYEAEKGRRALYGGSGCNNDELQGKSLLEVLLYDHTTKRNILWGTDGYGYPANSEILPEQICGQAGELAVNITIRPRVAKEKAEQQQRTKDKAEVFTPSWVCNKQNNLIDEAWFNWNPAEHDGWSFFNKEIDTDGHSWSVREPIEIDRTTFVNYINETRLEMTCGEAPYLVSRYDTTTGRVFTDLNERIGLLDRKLRLVNLMEDSRSNWNKSVKKAFASTYGFEWQGDNLLLAREALLYSFIEYYRAKWNEEPNSNTVMQIAEIVSWNLWQMDGITYNVPYTEMPAMIKNWRKMHSDGINEPPFAFASLIQANNKHK